MSVYTFRRYRGGIESVVVTGAECSRVELSDDGCVRVFTDPEDAVVSGVEPDGTCEVPFDDGMAPMGAV